MFERNITVGQVAVLLPKSMEYFSKIGVDYCCGGNRVLTEVLQEKALDADAVFSHLEQLQTQVAAQGGHRNFQAMSTGDLCDYIVDNHHRYLYQNLPEIDRLLMAVMRAHGAHHPELFQVGRLFGQLRAELEQHLLREELFLFPALKRADEGEAITLTPDIISEHVHAGAVLEALQTVTDHYTVPTDACATYAQVYRMLPEMEDDIHRHIHLENNILLKAFDIR